MESEEREIEQHQTNTQMTLTPPEEAYAGAEVALQVQVSCSETCGLQSGRVTIIDADGALVREVPLSVSDDGLSTTDEFVVTIPAVPGSYIWTAAFVPGEGEDSIHMGSSASFTFRVIPHHVSLSMWGAPRPVTLGREFVVKVGAKCSAGCSLAGLPISVRGGEEMQVHAGRLGDEPLPQTSGLYWTELTLPALHQAGLETLTVECQPLELELPHEVSGASTKLRIVSPPDRTVTVEVLDKERRTPLKGASVYAYPYRSITGADGVAKLQLTSGTHELYVKVQDYMDYQTTIEVDGDLAVAAEMYWVPDPFA